MKKFIPFVFLAVIWFQFGACEIFNSPDELQRGSFNVKVEGYVKHSFEREAIFETLHGLTGEPVFFLILKNVEGPGAKYRVIEFVRSDHGRPDVETYSLRNFETDKEADLGIFRVNYNNSDIYGMFRSKGGKLEIDKSNKKMLKGSFEFPAFEFIPESGEGYKRVEVLIKGEFFATEGSTGIILN